MIKSLRLKIIRYLLRKYIQSGKMRKVKINGLSIEAPSGVFKPAFVISTSLLIDVLKNEMKAEPTVDVCCGCGVIGLYYAKTKHAYVILSDISRRAAETAHRNAKKLQVAELVDVVVGDLLGFARRGSIQLVIANPPYLPLQAEDEVDACIAAGKNLELLYDLIKQSLKVLKPGGHLMLSLSSLSQPKKIVTFAVKLGFSKCKCVAKKLSPFDVIYVYKMSKEKS